VVADATGKVLPGVEVRASAASAGPDDCPADGSDQASSCERLRTSVLQKALAQDPFVPRTRSTFTENNGRFQIDGLDCGQCQPGAGARFDVSVRPPPEMRLPWLVRPGNSIDSVQAIQSQLRVQTPVAYPMKLTYGDPAGDGKSIGLPGALIRAFALLDDQSKLVTDIESLVPCATLTNPEGSHCVQSLLQVAELRSGDDGDFLLLLPPEIQ
jgi:hypothetical protein